MKCRIRTSITFILVTLQAIKQKKNREKEKKSETFKLKQSQIEHKHKNWQIKLSDRIWNNMSYEY